MNKKQVLVTAFIVTFLSSAAAAVLTVAVTVYKQRLIKPRNRK